MSDLGRIRTSDERANGFGYEQIRVVFKPIKHVARSPFMQLPAELRTKIFRFLHVYHKQLHIAPDPVYNDGDADDDDWIRKPNECRHYYLSAGSLRVCRQFYDEGSAILYGENTFEFSIFSHVTYEFAPFGKVDHIQYSELPLKKIKKYDIIVDLKEIPSIVKASVRRVSNVLSKFPGLWLKIWFVPHQNAEDATGCLKPFFRIQNASHVDFVGVPPECAKFLKRRMEGSSHLSLFRMNEKFQELAKIWEFPLEYLLKADEAAEDFDMVRFRRNRTQLIKNFDGFMRLHSSRKVYYRFSEAFRVHLKTCNRTWRPLVRTREIIQSYANDCKRLFREKKSIICSTWTYPQNSTATVNLQGENAPWWKKSGTYR